jgi:glycerophosphoryl diester phosphodiesterase
MAENVVNGQTTAASYVTDLPSNGGYDTTPLLTVGDEVPLLEGEIGNFTPSQDKTFAFAGIPDGTGVYETEDAYYVFVNHELSAERDVETGSSTNPDVLTEPVVSDISSTVEGQIQGARVSVFQFDKDWNVIGGKNLVETAVDSTGEYVLDTTSGAYINSEGESLSGTGGFDRFCSGYLATYGFEGGPIWFAPEEGDETSRGWAVTPDGTALALEGLGHYSKENVVAASEYRADNSEKTVLFSTEDFTDGELYMFVGQQTADDPNGFKDGDLYTLRVDDFDFETIPEGESFAATWTPVPDAIALNPNGEFLSDWVNAQGRSTDFERLEDFAEDPNNPGTFYFATTGTAESRGGDPTTSEDDATTPEDAANPYGRLYRFSLNPDDPTGAISDFELVHEGGPGKGVSYDNITVDSNGHVLIQEDETAFGGDVMTAENRDARVYSYNIASDTVTPLLGVVESAAGAELNDPAEVGEWETSGIIEVDPDAQPDTSSYLFDVQAHTIEDPNYVEGGQLLLATPGDGPINGTDGSNTLDGTKADDTIFGDSETYGPGGDDTIDAKGGSDRVFAGSGNDTAAGGLGNDLIYGNDGDDILRGDSPPETLHERNRRSPSGPGGNDAIYGGNGNDRIGGKGGNDSLYGEEGDDRIWGSQGNDKIYGGAGNDEAYGGAGNDEFYASETDSDTWTGGVGNDQFWIVDAATPGSGSVITDFQAGEDVIGLGNGLAFANLEINSLGNDALISLKDNGALALLEGIDAGTISISDFVSTAARPLIIGHRGASGLRPEHTLASYELAIEQGADFIEPDLVATKDGVLIARHENAIATVDPATGEVIEATTDVAEHPEFADRLTTKVVDGAEIRGWFTEDFTLDEIKTLRAVERLEIRDQSFNGQFEIPTFEEIIDLVKQVEADTGREIGIYPETKHPTYHDSIGLSLEERLVDTLVANDFTDPNRVFIQSFEVGNLKELNDSIMPDAGVDLPLVQLLDAADISLDGTLIENQPYDFVDSGDSRTYGDLRTPEGLAEIAGYADGIGPWKRMIVSVQGTDSDGDGIADDLTGDGLVNDADKTLTDPTSLVDDAHAAGLLVHPYTFRNEDQYLASDYSGNPELEYEQFFSLGVDGLFTDFPGTGFEVASRLYPSTAPDPTAGVGLLAAPTDAVTT